MELENNSWLLRHMVNQILQRPHEIFIDVLTFPPACVFCAPSPFFHLWWVSKIPKGLILLTHLWPIFPLPSLHLELSWQDYIWATQQLMAVANRCCGGFSGEESPIWNMVKPMGFPVKMFPTRPSSNEVFCLRWSELGIIGICRIFCPEWLGNCWLFATSAGC